MPLQVIGAGLGRTGTMTLKCALETLGFGPCHHMVEVFANPGQVPWWNRAGDGKAIDWERIYAPYGATVDWPGAHFYAELAGRYPKAKVVLSTRDAESWYESMAKTILVMLGQFAADDGSGALPADHPMRFGQSIIVQGTFGGDFSKANVIAAYERHNAEVRRRIPSHRLLEFQASQGWEPLCAFLGAAVPDEPFPRTNSHEEFWEHATKGRDTLKAIVPSSR